MAKKNKKKWNFITPATLLEKEAAKEYARKFFPKPRNPKDDGLEMS